MPAAVWMIQYDLDPAHAERYLSWFNSVHIPEKLERPGYTWAAHYRVVDDLGADQNRYIALFGGVDSRVFYNPSPAQIKPTQPPETRAMMALRTNSHMQILAAEWRADGSARLSSVASAIDAEWIQLLLFNADTHDEDLGAWLVQKYLPDLAGAAAAHKFLASTGASRHALLQTSNVIEDLHMEFAHATADEWSQRVAAYLSFPLGGPLRARRVWPSLDAEH